MYGGKDHQGWLHFFCFNVWVLSKVTPEDKTCSTPRSSALLASLQAQMLMQVQKKKKLFSWAKSKKKCLGQRLAVNTYKFLSHPWGSDLLNSLCVLPVRSLPWHIPVCPWKGSVCWRQSWGQCRQQSRGDEKCLRAATVQFPENSVEKVSFPLDKIHEALVVQRQPPAQSQAGAREESPCSRERQRKQRATLP